MLCRQQLDQRCLLQGREGRGEGGRGDSTFNWTKIVHLVFGSFTKHDFFFFFFFFFLTFVNSRESQLAQRLVGSP